MPGESAEIKIHSMYTKTSWAAVAQEIRKFKATEMLPGHRPAFPRVCVDLCGAAPKVLVGEFPDSWHQNDSSLKRQDFLVWRSQAE